MSSHQQKQQPETPALLQPNQPRKFEAVNIRTPVRSSSKGDIFLVQFQVNEEAHAALRAIPKLGVIIEAVLWYSDGDGPPVLLEQVQPEKVAKPKTEKGPYSGFWNAMFKRGFINYPFLARHDPFFETVRSHPRFKQLLDVVHDRWEKFEV